MNQQFTVMQQEEFIRNFIKKDKQERVLCFAKNRKNRKKFVAGVAHSKFFEERFLEHIRPDDQTPAKIEIILRKHGASDTCYVISEHSKLDQKRLNLRYVLSELVGSGISAILLFESGKIAYYESEELGGRYLLINKSN